MPPISWLTEVKAPLSNIIKTIIMAVGSAAPLLNASTRSITLPLPISRLQTAATSVTAVMGKLFPL